MENKTYHHGDLKRALIETGIKPVHEEGEKNFSLRRIAAEYGVSSAAPYAHFKNKDTRLTGSCLRRRGKHMSCFFTTIRITIRFYSHKQI